MDSRPQIAPDRRIDRLTIVLLVVAAVAPFLRTLLFGYVMDEVTAIRSNSDLAGWASLARVWSREYGSPDAPFVGLYRPFTMMVFALLRNVGHGWPVWFHLLAVGLHALATVLAWKLLRRAVSPGAALPGALFFAVHPVHVEAVANVANVSEVLVAIWSILLALHLTRDDRGATLWHAAIAGLLFFLALASKESGAVAPVLALLCVWGWNAAKSAETRPSFRAIATAWLLALLVVVTLRWQVLGGPVSGRSIAAPGLDTLSFGERIWSMLSLGPRVAGLLVWPTQINPGYGPSVFEGATSMRAAATLLAIVLALVACGLAARRGDRRWLVALGWILIAFLPASNLLVATGQVLAERTLYVSSVGVAMVVALVAHAVAQRLVSGRAVAGRRVLLAAGVAVCLVLAARTFAWTRVWATHENVYRQMIAADSTNYRGYWSMAIYEGNSGRMPNATALLERAYALYPSDRGLTYDYADALYRSGRPAEAARIAEGYLDSREYRERPAAVGLYVLALRHGYGADSVIAAGNRLMTPQPTAIGALLLGQGYELRGDRARALEAYRSGLQHFPDDALLQSQMARLNATR